MDISAQIIETVKESGKLSSEAFAEKHRIEHNSVVGHLLSLASSEVIFNLKDNFLRKTKQRMLGFDKRRSRDARERKL